MGKRKYTPGRNKISFSPIGQGLQQSRYEIQADAKRRSDAVKLSRQQQWEADQSKISSQANKAKFEQGVLIEKQKLAQAIRDRQYEALAIKADRDVGRLKGEAKLKKDYAEWEAKYGPFAPKSLENIKKLVGGVYEFNEYLEFKGLNKAYEKAGLFDLADKEANEVRTKLYKNWLKEQNKVASPEAWDLFIRNFQGKDNVLFSSEILDIMKKNKNFYVQNVKSFINDLDTKSEKDKKALGFTEGSLGWTKGTVVDHFEDAGYMHLDHLGIDARSKGGRRILAQYRAWGTLERNKLENEDRVNQTKQNIAQNIRALKHEPTGEVDQVQFETLVNSILKGTFTDGKGNFYHVTNKAEAVQIALERYVSEYHEDFRTEEEVRLWIDKFVIPGDSEKGDKAVSLTKKLGNRVDLVVNSWVTGNDRKRKLKRAQTEAEDTQFENAFDQRFSEALRKNQENPGSVDMDQFWIKEVDRASKQVGGSERSQNYVYKAANIQLTARDHVGTWVSIRQLQEEGDWVGAAALYGRLTPAVQKRLAPQFEKLDFANQAGMVHGNKYGYPAMFSKAKAIHLAGESTGTGGRSLSDSGVQSYGMMADRVIVQAIAIQADHPNLTKKQALDKAWEIEEDLYNQGHDKRNPFEYGEGPYARRHGIFETTGKKEKRYIYKNAPSDYDDDEDIHAIQLERLQAGDYRKAREEIRNLDIQVYSADTVRTLSKAGFKDYNEWIDDPRFVSPKTINDFISLAKSYASGNIAFESVTIPENITTLAKLTHRSEIQVVNDLMAKWIPEGETDLRFSDDGQGASMKRNGGQWIRPENVLGTTMIDAAKAQFILPKDQEVHFNIDEGLGIEESFLAKHGISIDDLGNYSDTNLFLKEGGAQFLDFDAADRLFGLQNITRWRMKDELYSDNPYTNKKAKKIKKPSKKTDYGKLPIINR